MLFGTCKFWDLQIFAQMSSGASSSPLDEKVRLLWKLAVQTACIESTEVLLKCSRDNDLLAGEATSCHSLAPERPSLCALYLRQLWELCLENNASPPATFFKQVCLCCFNFLIPLAVDTFPCGPPPKASSAAAAAAVRSIHADSADTLCKDREILAEEDSVRDDRRPILQLDQVMAVHFPMSMSAQLRRTRRQTFLNSKNLRLNDLCKVQVQCRNCFCWTQSTVIQRKDKGQEQGGLNLTSPLELKMLQDVEEVSENPLKVAKISGAHSGPSSAGKSSGPSSAAKSSVSASSASAKSRLLSQVKEKLSANKQQRQSKKTGGGFADFLASIQ